MIQIKTSEQLQELAAYYIKSEEVRKNVVNSIIKKGSTSIAEIYAPMYKFYQFCSLPLHAFSLVIALPCISMIGVMFFAEKIGFQINPMIAYAIGGMLLFMAEWGQQATLDVTWDTYYKKGNKHSQDMGFMSALFSIFSIASSGYSAYYFFGNSEYIYWGVGLSAFIEILIIWRSQWVNWYEYACKQEGVMVNDMQLGYNYNSLPIQNMEFVAQGGSDKVGKSKMNGNKYHSLNLEK